MIEYKDIHEFRKDDLGRCFFLSNGLPVITQRN